MITPFHRISFTKYKIEHKRDEGLSIIRTFYYIKFDVVWSVLKPFRKRYCFNCSFLFVLQGGHACCLFPTKSTPKTGSGIILPCSRLSRHQFSPLIYVGKLDPRPPCLRVRQFGTSAHPATERRVARGTNRGEEGSFEAPPLPLRAGLCQYNLARGKVESVEEVYVKNVSLTAEHQGKTQRRL